MEHKIVGRPPRGRYDHAMQRFKNTIVLFGGRKLGINDAFATNIYLLRLDTLMWTKVH